jgi:hypothetical protein
MADSRMKNITRLPLARNDGLVIRELDDETLVYDTETDKAHCLNRTASLVWEHCDGKTTATQAARLLQNTVGADVDDDLIWMAVRQLQKFHLVERTTKSPSVSRRDVVLKYAAAALALPVIFSITAPTAFAAASCATQGQSCATIPCCPGLNCDGTCFPN